MKKPITRVLLLILAIMLLLALPMLALLPGNAYADEISVIVNGQPVNFADYPPTIVDGRTLVPVRGVFEVLGFEVEWDSNARIATLTSDDYEITITIGSDTFITNNQAFTLDVPAQIIGASTMLPIRAVLESVGYHVDWNAATRTVFIYSEFLLLHDESGQVIDVLTLSLDGIRQQLPLEGVFRGGRIWLDAAQFSLALGLPAAEEAEKSFFELCELFNLFVYFDQDTGLIELFSGHQRPRQLPAAGEGHAIIRIEDVVAGGISARHNELIYTRIISDLLWTHNASFTIAWIPVYVYPARSYRNDPREYSRHNWEFIFTMDYMVSRGGEVGLHGYTHQRGDQITVGGYEFGPEVDEATARELFRLQLAAAEYFGWTAYSFTFPKYFATRSQFEIAGEYFDIIWPQPYWSGLPLLHFERIGERDVLYLSTPEDHVLSTSDEHLLEMLERISNAGEIANFFFHFHLEHRFITIQRDENGFPVITYDADSFLHRILDTLEAEGRVLRSPTYFLR